MKRLRKNYPILYIRTGIINKNKTLLVKSKVFIF